MPLNDSYNFKKTGLYDRIKALVGGNEQRVKDWWKTPVPQAPFNVRAPEELMNDAEWRSVRDWLMNTVPGDYINDTDFKAQSERFGYLINTGTAFKLTDRPMGYGGTESKLFWLPPGYKSNDTLVWRVHVFTSSGTFHLERGGEIEYLVVGGGGGGGGSIDTNSGGGGGGGGVVTGKVMLGAAKYEVIVGGGGTGGNDLANMGTFASKFPSTTAGGYSKFHNIYAYGGGAGGTTTTVHISGSPTSGATGGGGSPDNGTPTLTNVPPYNPNRIYGAKSLYNPEQGYDGGNGLYYNNENVAYNGGGGGGAGGPGGNATRLKAGDGGIGRISDITGDKVYYGGGGAGGCYGSYPYYIDGGKGGLGGGASTNGHVQLVNNPSDTPLPGTPNTGGGGGGGHANNPGSNGGSGVVIVRYRLTV